MAHTLIKGRAIVQDEWQTVDTHEGVDPRTAVIVPSKLWMSERDQWLKHSGPIGIQLEPNDDLNVLEPDLSRWTLIAVRFPSFTDGRGYSSARLLREKYGFKGEIRAVGDVFKDVLFYLSRVGFDAFLLREGEDAADALKGLDTFSEAYQVSVERASPLFRRRLEAHG